MQFGSAVLYSICMCAFELVVGSIKQRPNIRSIIPMYDVWLLICVDPVRSLMAQWLRWASKRHEICCSWCRDHGLKPDQVNLWMCNPSKLDWDQNYCQYWLVNAAEMSYSFVPAWVIRWFNLSHQVFITADQAETAWCGCQTLLHMTGGCVLISSMHSVRLATFFQQSKLPTIAIENAHIMLLFCLILW